MRVQWYSVDGQTFQIDSDNPQLIAEWLKELIIKYREAMNHPAWMSPRITFYPSGEYSSREWPHYTQLNVEQLKWLVAGLRNMETMKVGEDFKL